MSSEAEVKELKPRMEAEVTSISQGGGDADPGRRSELELNRQTARRIAESEARQCLPALNRARVIAQWGKQLRAIAEYGGDQETEKALQEALDRLTASAS